MNQQVQAQGFNYEGLPTTFVETSLERATRVKELDAKTGRNIITMGAVLKEQRDAFGSLGDKTNARGSNTWEAWVQRELRWENKEHANKLIRVYEVFGTAASGAAVIGYRLLIDLSSKNTPPELRERVIAMAQAGETPTRAEVQVMKREAAGEPAPTPTEAKAKAKATGEVQVGSDNRMYTPIEEADADAYEKRRDRTYGALDAIVEIAGIGCAPETWLTDADTHWLNDFNLGATEEAATWLTALATAYRKTEKVIEGKA